MVTTLTHPQLHEAFETISHDCGAGAGHETYSVPPEWSDKLQSVEEALRPLTDPELQDFCIGEESDQKAIAARSPELKYASTLLNAFFEDWDHVP